MMPLQTDEARTLSLLSCALWSLVLQNLINTLRVPNPYNGKEYAMRIIDAKSMVATCKSNYEDWKRLMYQDLLAIDDLGTEPREVMDYGNIINPTVDILTRRYEETVI